MISIEQKGDFKALTAYLKKVNKNTKIEILDKYGQEGVRLLSKATPVRSGKTANSWYYKIERSKKVGYRVEIISILLSNLFLIN